MESSLTYLLEAVPDNLRADDFYLKGHNSRFTKSAQIDLSSRVLSDVQLKAVSEYLIDKSFYYSRLIQVDGPQFGYLQKKTELKQEIQQRFPDTRFQLLEGWIDVPVFNLYAQK